MRSIKLMPDYYCFPLWDLDNHGNIEPGELPISKILEQKLWSWAEKFDAILNKDNPALSGFKTPEEEKKFLLEGLLLARNLKYELGKDFNIEYWPLYSDKDIPSDIEIKITVCI